MEIITPRIMYRAKDYFEKVRDKNPKLCKSGAMMVALLEYLEQEVDWPPQRTGINGPAELIFFGEKIFNALVLVNAYPREMDENLHYEIKYALEPQWTYAVGYASNVESAAEMILYGLKHAYPKGQRISTEGDTNLPPIL